MSQQLLFQGTSHVPQPPPLFSNAHTAVSASQPPSQPKSIPSWADQVATAEQSGRSTPEIVVPNCAFSGRTRGARPRSQPLVYSPPVMPTPHCHNADRYPQSGTARLYHLSGHNSFSLSHTIRSTHVDRQLPVY